MGSRGLRGRMARGGQDRRRAWAAETGKGYHRRLARFWRRFEGQKIGHWRVLSVERRLAKGIEPDLVIEDVKSKTIYVHDPTGQWRKEHGEKGKRYVAYFERRFPGHRIEYSEGYWHRLLDVWEALDKDAKLYWPKTRKP